MTTLSAPKSQGPKTAAPKKVSAKSDHAPLPKVASAAAKAKTPPQVEAPKLEPVTKRERVLSLLSRPEGAGFEELMQATDWRQHSVRGFLAGTVFQCRSE